MKKAILLLLFSSICFGLMADRREVILNPTTPQHDHFEHYAPADMPEAVYYDSDDDEIIIVADGFSSYYDVLIIRNSTNQTMVSTQISGYGDTIDVSALPSDNFTIVITSEYNNVFEGQFSIL